VPAATGSGVTAAVAINARLTLEDADQAVARARAPVPASAASPPDRAWPSTTS
jgi:hypothetical protein